MDLSIKNTTKEQRREIVKNAFALSSNDNFLPSKNAINIIKEYIDGISEIDVVQKKIMNLYKREDI